MQLVELRETHEFNAVYSNNAADAVPVPLHPLVHELWPEPSVPLLLKIKISGLYFVH